MAVQAWEDKAVGTNQPRVREGESSPAGGPGVLRAVGVQFYCIFCSNKKPLVPNLLAHTLAHHSKNYLPAHYPGLKVGMKGGWGEVARPPRKRAATTPAFGAGVQPHLQGSFGIIQGTSSKRPGEELGGGGAESEAQSGQGDPGTTDTGLLQGRHTGLSPPLPHPFICQPTLRRSQLRWGLTISPPRRPTGSLRLGHKGDPGTPGKVPQRCQHCGKFPGPQVPNYTRWQVGGRWSGQGEGDKIPSVPAPVSSS